MSFDTATLNISYLKEMHSQDLAAVNQLQKLLTHERELLEKRQHQDLQDIVLQKNQLLETLTFNAKQRAQLLRAAGLETTLAGWQQLLMKEPSTHSLIPDWLALTADFIACKEANEINGRMISRSKQTLTHLLNLIRGQVPMPSLYTQKGATTNTNRSHTMVKA